MKLLVFALGGLAGAFVVGSSEPFWLALLAYLLFEQRHLARTVDELRGELRGLRPPESVASGVESPPAPTPPAGDMAVAPEPATAHDAPAGAPVVPPAAGAASREAARAARRRRSLEEATRERRPGPEAGALLARVRAFALGGNTLVRAGVVILFIGLAFGVQYAVEHQLFPIELRLAATALAGMLLTATGWRLRERRRDFGLTLQGGGTAILYLTIFAAFRLYDLIPSGSAFLLLLVVTACGGALALLQNAQALAVLSLAGGFLAPVLASTGDGSHIVLFSYFAILNAGVVALAWFRAWRGLNLVGFALTFGIAGLWVSEAYQPALYLETQAFLALFFLAYVAVALLQVRRAPGEQSRLVDGTLVFGLPVAAFTLQAALVQHVEFGLAWSAFALGAFYGGAAWLLFRRAPATLLALVEAYAGIGLALGTMVLPFALDATWTGAGWALEGAALVWLGFRQRRALLRLAGAGLQLVAMAVLFGASRATGDVVPLLHPTFVGAVSVAAAALFTAHLFYARRREGQSWEAPLAPLFLGLGLLWWLGGAMGEVGRLVPDRVGLHVNAVLLSVTALACAALYPRLAWPALRVPALLALPLLFPLLAATSFFVPHPFSSGGLIAWPLAVASHLIALRLVDADLRPRVAGLFHGMTLWFVACVLAWAAGWAARTLAPAETVWPHLATGAVLITIIALTVRASTATVWPIGQRRAGYLLWGIIPLLAAAWYWSLLVSGVGGGPSPLPYLPLLNPLDVLLAIGAVVSVGWYRAARPILPASGGLPGWLLAATAFVWVNATLARTVHTYAGTPYDLDTLLATSIFQTGLTILWSTIAVTVMAIAAGRNLRKPWIAAATLLAVTVLKLFLVDLAALSTLPRIASFVGVGLLLLLVGYVAPVPPERPEPPPTGGTPDFAA